MQVVGPSGIDSSRFDRKMIDSQQNRLIAYHELITQMRVKGGNDYIMFIKALLNAECKTPFYSDSYELALYTDFSKFNDLLYQKETECGLSRMVAGYAWEWISKKDKTQRDIKIDGISKMWNHCTEGWVLTEEAIDEVGCIHSIQGYDLNYAFVILGNDIAYDKTSRRIIVRPKNYYDKNGKRTASYDELLEYIKNVYYVLLTRGIKGTYLYVCDPDLRAYLSQFMKTEN